MKKRYVIPAFDIVFISTPLLDYVTVAESYPVNPYNPGSGYTIGGEEDDDSNTANQVSHSLWDEE